MVLTNIKDLLSDESGQGMVEYAFILLLVALACIGGLKVLGSGIKAPLEEVASELS